MNMPWSYGGMRDRHTGPLSLYPLIPYTHALDHSVTVRAVKTMLFILTTVELTHWRNFIQSWRPCMCQDWKRCGTHLFPLLRNW